MQKTLTQILCATTCGLAFVTGCQTNEHGFGVVRGATRSRCNAILRVVINYSGAGRLPLTIGGWRVSYEGRAVHAVH